MKYIPIESFENLNSLLMAVEEEPGMTTTIRLEAFTCRNTKEEKQVATELAHYISTIQATPPTTPSPLFHSPFDADAPPVLVLGSSAVQPTESSSGTAEVGAQDVDERLVFCVTALNGMYSDEGYDFTVLSYSDFVSHEESTVVQELNHRLQRFSMQCPAIQFQFWPAIKEVVGDAADGCEYIEFCCPSCDPLNGSSLFSHTYFLYNKKRKLLVSLVLYVRSAEVGSPLNLGSYA